MKNTMGRVPNLKNSSYINSMKLQNAKQKMNTSSSTMTGLYTGLTSSTMPNLSNSTSINQYEKQKVKEKIQQSNSSYSNMLY